MKKVFIIQTLDLKHSGCLISPSCFKSEKMALQHVNEMKRVYADLAGIDIDSIEKRYVFNVLTLDVF